MGRHEQREQIFKLLFRADFHAKEDIAEQVELFFQDDETVFSEKEINYIKEKFNAVYEKLPEIDQMINENAKGWEVIRIGKVELTIIRLGIYEVLFDEEIPAGVAINEAVEISKLYGQDNSSAFINAILAKFVPTQSKETL